MKPNLKDRITVRLDAELLLNLEIMEKASNHKKSQIIRMILNDFFYNNEEQLNQYYEKIKTN